VKHEMPNAFKALAESMHVAHPLSQWEALVERNRGEFPETHSWPGWLKRAPKKQEPKQAELTTPKHHPQYPPVPLKDWEKRPLTEEERAASVAAGKAALEMLERMSPTKKKPVPRATLEELDAATVAQPNLEKAIAYARGMKEQEHHPSAPITVEEARAALAPPPHVMARALERTEQLGATSTPITINDEEEVREAEVCVEDDDLLVD
jgi:hypothetical protein